jgi:hypothetical protein
MYTRLLRSILATAFSTVVAFGALSAVDAAQAKAPAQHAVGLVQAAVVGGDRGVGALVVPADTGWVAPADTGWVAPADTGWVAPADTGWIAPADTGWVAPADTGWRVNPSPAISDGSAASVNA